MKRYTLGWFFLLLSFICGCTVQREIRTEYGSLPMVEKLGDASLMRFCERGISRSGPGRELKNSIEDYESYILGYVEYSDQGWEYSAGAQRKALMQRLNDDLRSQDFTDTVQVNIVFIHGWHHSSNSDDCNVNEFRAMLRRLNLDLNDVAKKVGSRARFRVNGIYVGWRGESLTVPLLRQATIVDRLVTSEHVAKGAVRELFADLRNLQLTDAETGTGPFPKGRVRTIVVGHSLGALIAFHSLSPGLINDLALSKPLPSSGKAEPYVCGKAARARSFWPNLTVLINPAFEASRFEALNNTATESLVCDDESPRPKLIVVAAENDMATRTFFPILRTVRSTFEQYDATSATMESMEREANTHTVGFVDRYLTHRLELLQIDDTDKCVNQVDARVGASSGSVKPSRHLWVVRVSQDIVFGHDGFLYPKDGVYEPYLLNWLVSVYLDDEKNESPLARSYRNYRCVLKPTPG